MPIKTPRTLFLTAIGLTLSLLLAPLHADETLKEGETIVPVMFVQNAAASQYKDGVLTLKTIQPDLLWFSDRPYRMAGTTSLEEYMKDWDDAADGFRADPPNATLSYLSGETMTSVAMELTEPTVDGNDISYRVKLLEGTPANETGPVSLFVDFVGMVWHRPLVVDRPLIMRRPVVVTRPFMVRPAPVVVTTPPTVVIKNPAPATVVVDKAQPVEVQSYSSSKTEEKLRQLKGMYDQGLISRSEYKRKQEELLKKF